MEHPSSDSMDFASDKATLDTDYEMSSDGCDNELPEVTSALQALLDASTAPNLKHKRAASCPPSMSIDDDVGLDDIDATMADLGVAEPKSDPVTADEQQAAKVTIENAQTLLDPNACLFVANLPIHVSDDEMQMALTQFMSDGNELYVKVNRMREGMPFAHVQYRDVQTAQHMLESKQRQILWGRQLRIEPACATRKLYVGRRTDSHELPSESEMRVLFQGFEIDTVCAPSDEEKKESKTGRCVVVHFVKWGECGEALRALRSNERYWMKTPKKSHLASPSKPSAFPVSQPPIQPQMPFGNMPFIDFNGTFTNMMPTMPPFFSMMQMPIITPPPSPERPNIKRRRRNYQPRGDGSPQRQFGPRW